MGLDEEATPSRWRIFMEVRDSLRQALVPALTLAHLLAYGPRIAKRARIKRPARPLHALNLMRILTK